jgi:hypothetical protein
MQLQRIGISCCAAGTVDLRTLLAVSKATMRGYLEHRNSSTPFIRSSTMAGPAWRPEEELILITYKRAGYFDKDIHQTLQQRGMDRSLVALRSKLYELRKDPAVFDGPLGEWKEEAVRHLIRKVEAERERGENEAREKEGDQAQYDLA